MPNGERSVVNKEGFSQQDAQSAMAEFLLMSLPAAKLASIPLKLSTKFALSAGVFGAIDAGMQKAAQAVGSKQPYDPLQTAIVAGTGGVGEVAVPIAKAGMRQFGKMKGRADINKMVREGRELEDTAPYLLKGAPENKPFIQEPNAAEILSDLTPVIDDIQQPRLEPPQDTFTPDAVTPDDGLQGDAQFADIVPQIPVPTKGVVEVAEQLLPKNGRVVKSKTFKALEHQQVPLGVSTLIRESNQPTRSAMKDLLNHHYNEVNGGTAKGYTVIGKHLQPRISKILAESSKAVDLQQKSLKGLEAISGANYTPTRLELNQIWSDQLGKYNISNSVDKNGNPLKPKDRGLSFNSDRTGAYINKPASQK